MREEKPEHPKKTSWHGRTTHLNKLNSHNCDPASESGLEHWIIVRRGEWLTVVIIVIVRDLSEISRGSRGGTGCVGVFEFSAENMMPLP